MSDRLARLTPAGLTAEQAALYQSIAGGPRGSGPQHFALADESGALHGPFGLLLHAPAVGGAVQELGAAIRYRGTLSDRQRELAILLVAAGTGSDFEWFAHVRVGLASGVSVAEMAAIAEGTFAPDDALEAALVAVCEAVLADRGVPEQDYAAHRAAVGEQRLVELVVLVGYYRLLASMLAYFEVSTPTDERVGEFPPLRS